MKQVRMIANEVEGYAVTVKVEGDTAKYSEVLLHIFNNVRVNDELCYVTNDYGNNITVYCDLESKEDLVEYLEQFGEVTECEKVLMYELEGSLPPCDYEKHAMQVVVPCIE